MLDILKNVGPAELVIVILVVGGVFGSQKLKKLAEGLGESARELKGIKQELDSVKSDVSEVIGGGK